MTGRRAPRDARVTAIALLEPEPLSIELVGGWSEAQRGRGEDAEPSLMVRPGLGFVAVYDGLGGAGASPVSIPAEDVPHSNAWFGSRIVRAATEDWVRRRIEVGLRKRTPSLQETVDDALRSALAVASAPSGVKGTLPRSLPTTLAALLFQSRGDGRQVDVVALWAGNSRAYLLTAQRGLQVLTTDDAPMRDALESLVTDPPLTNFIAADRPYVIHERQLAVEAPAVLVVASDGCFGDLPTPAHLEQFLLAGLAPAASFREWAEAALDTFGQVASDDISFALAALGYPSFVALQDAMRPRLERLNALLASAWAPASGGAAAQDAARREVWREYRPAYEAMLDGVEAAEGT